MPHRRHMPGAGQFDPLPTHLGDSANLGCRRLDVAVWQAGETDLAVWVIAAEVVHEVVVDAQHLVGRFAILDFRASGEDAVDHLGVDTVAVELLDAQMRIAGPAVALLLEIVIETGFGHLVDAQLLARYIDGTYGANPARHAEIRAFIVDPAFRPVRLLGDIRHFFLECPRRLRPKQIGRQPDHVEVTISRYSPVLHNAPSTLVGP